MSECNNFFLFYDSFLETYGMWELKDCSHLKIRAALEMRKGKKDKSDNKAVG